MRLTLRLGDGAADGGAGGGDGAHGGAHAIRRVHPSHGRCVGHPGSGVNGSDGFTWGFVDNMCNEDWLQLNNCTGIHDNRREVLTPRQSEAAARVGVPTLGNSQSNGAGNTHNERERMNFNGADLFLYNKPCSDRNLLSSSRHRRFVLNDLYVSLRLLSKEGQSSLPQPWISSTLKSRFA